MNPSMALAELLHGMADVGTSGQVMVRGLSLDSRAIRPGDAFVALDGTREHGIRHARSARDAGAVAVLAEAPAPADSAAPEGSIWIEGLGQRLGSIAARFYGEPGCDLRIVGVTGTNGKTSTVWLLSAALSALGRAVASIGTLGSGRPGVLRSGERTTPDAIHMQRSLAGFRADGVDDVVMEVSSHALVQGRVNAVPFALAVFTNLTRDHLDYHGNMEAYGEAKARLFAWPGLAAAVINIDDPFGAELARRLPASVQCLRFSTRDCAAELHAADIVCDDAGLAFRLVTPWGGGELRVPLFGRFQVANLLAVAGCLGALGVAYPALAGALARSPPVPGRMQCIGGGDQPLVVVDYAHTPDALEQALLAARAHARGRLWCVFGAGGDRDSGKRSEMGAVVERHADGVVVTDDNPRTESGDAIVADILAGFQVPNAVRIERDRGAAIASAVGAAVPGDVVLIAGKGHESYQEVGIERRPFDDVAVARTALEGQG